MLLWRIFLSQFNSLKMIIAVGQAFCEVAQSFVWHVMIVYSIFLLGKPKIFRLLLHVLSSVFLWNGAARAKAWEIIYVPVLVPLLPRSITFWNYNQFMVKKHSMFRWKVWVSIKDVLYLSQQVNKQVLEIKRGPQKSVMTQAVNLTQASSILQKIRYYWGSDVIHWSEYLFKLYSSMNWRMLDEKKEGNFSAVLQTHFSIR